MKNKTNSLSGKTHCKKYQVLKEVCHKSNDVFSFLLNILSNGDTTTKAVADKNEKKYQ